MTDNNENWGIIPTLYRQLVAFPSATFNRQEWEEGNRKWAKKYYSTENVTPERDVWEEEKKRNTHNFVYNPDDPKYKDKDILYLVTYGGIGY